MQKSIAKRLVLPLVILFSVGLLTGCGGMQKAAPDRMPEYLYYPVALVDADDALKAAKAEGKDRQCPYEFNAAKGLVERAYDTYLTCFTEEAIATAEDAKEKIKALCPAGLTPPLPPPPPPPAPKPELKPAPAPVKIILEDVHFDFDKATLTEEAKAVLARDTRTLKENPSLKVHVEGHTCAHGKDDYNMALGERRANAVKEHLVNAGIAAARLTTISYGETRLVLPEVPTAENKDANEAKENRRVHFEVISK